MPKIYNALITTKEKLLPSEAYPATTGPVFQPIGLTGEPVLLNPEAFVKKSQSGEDLQDDGEMEDLASPEQPRPFSKKEKEVPPVVFYPRYSVYYPHQPVLPFSNIYQQPLVYTAFEKPTVDQPAPTLQSREPLENEDATAAPEVIPPLPAGVTYVKNNSPKHLGIPDVPPPPPPVGAPQNARSAEEQEDADDHPR